MKLSLILVATFAAATLAVPWIAAPKREQWWHDKHAAYVNNTLNNPGGIRVIFYGDSITEWWGQAGKSVFDKYYAPLGAVNYGIYDEYTENILYRVRNGEITNSINPKLCVLKIGTNNLETEDENSTALGVAFDVMELRERLPNMKVLLLAILPRENEEFTRRIFKTNEIIKHLDNGKTIRFLDMKDHFYRGGNDFIQGLWDPDLIHLTTAGYQKWAEVMDPLFKEMLNS